MDVLYLLRVLWYRAWILLSVPVVASVAGFFFASSQEEVYKSTAQLSTGLTLRNEVSFENESFNIREIEIKFNNLMENMKSDKLVSLVSFRLLLHDLENSPFRNKINKEFSTNLLVTKTDTATVTNFLESKIDSLEVLSNSRVFDLSVLKYLKSKGYDHQTLKKNLNISRIKFTDYILVSYTSENPQLSAFVVNTLCDEFIRYNFLTNMDKTDASVKFFSQLVEQKKKELDEKTDALRTYKLTKGVSNFQAESQLQDQQIAQYELLRDTEAQRVQQLEISKKNLEARLKDMKSGSNGAEEIRTLNAKIITLRSDIQRINEKYVQTGSQDQVLMDSLVALRREYQFLTDKVNGLVSNRNTTQLITQLENDLEQTKVDLEVAQSSLSSIEFKIRTMRFDKSDFANKEIIIDDLEREVELASQEYKEAQGRFNDARNESMAAGSTIKKVMDGQPALNPESNHTLVISLLSFVASFSLCVFFILVGEFLDFSIKTPDRFERITGLSLLGSLNQVKKFGQYTKNIKALFTLEDNREAEIYVQFLRNLRFEIEKKQVKTILFTSTKRGEGKTSVIISLAYALSLVKKHVLIIDTNFKNNQLTRLLTVENDPNKRIGEGKKTNLVVEGYFDRDEPKGALIDTTIYPFVDKIISRPSPKSASEILIEKDFAGLLKEVSMQYDYVFMEGAALNEHSDTKELSEFVDLVIPVFSADSSIKAIDRDSIRYLKALDHKLGGCILNNVDIRYLKV